MKDTTIKSAFSWRTIFSWGLAILFMVIGLSYLYFTFTEFVLVIQEFSLTNFVFVLFLSTIILYLRGVLIAFLLDPFDVRLTIWEYTGLSTVTSMGNYLLPISGIAFRAVYLKQVYKLPYSTFASTLAGVYGFIFFTNVVVALVCLLSLGSKSWSNTFIAGLFFLLVCSIAMLVVSCFIPTRWLKGRYMKFVSHSLLGWQKITSNRTLTLKCVFLVTLLISVNSLITYICFQTFNIPIGILQSIVITCMGLLIVWIKLTPASFGILEGVTILTAQLFAITPTQSLLMTTLTRLAMIIVSFSLGPVYMYYLNQRLIRSKNPTNYISTLPE